MTERNTRVFVTHTFEGTRFEQHTMPVEVLSEFIAYKQLVVAVARCLFFERNPGRKRAPKGFDEKFRLELASISEGSACNQLVRQTEAPSDIQLWLIERDEFDEANEIIMAAIAGAPKGEVPALLTDKVIAQFNNFGNSLRDDETLFIEDATGPRSRVPYNRAVKKQLILHRAQTYENDVSIVGKVVLFDSEMLQFVIRTDDSRVSGRLDPDGTDAGEASKIIGTAVSADGLLVRVTGRGAFDRRDALTKLVRVHEVSYAEDDSIKDQLDVGKRLEFIAQLEAGWWDGAGPAIDKAAVEWVASFLAEAIGEEDPRPRLYPTMEGTILGEWTFPDAEVSAEFDPEARNVQMVGTIIRARAQRHATLTSPTELMRFVVSFGPPGMGGVEND